MAIQQLEVNGFRSLRTVVWEPGKLNLLVGPNGSGKSNLLRLLEFIGAAAAGQLAKTVREAGGIVPLLWNSATSDLGWRVRIDPVDEGRHRDKDAITYSLTLGQLGGGSSYEIIGDSLGNWYKCERGEMESPYWIFERNVNRAMVFDRQAQKLVRLQDDDFDFNESLLSQISDPTNSIPRDAKRVFESWRVHHDVHAERGSPMRQPATTQHVRLVSADGDNLTNVLHTLYTGDRDFKDQVDSGMRAAFGVDYGELQFIPAASQQVQLAVWWRSCRKPHAAPDLSDGTLRFLFLLAALANPHPAALVAIDEPETGLNPSMLPIVAEYAAEAADRTQVILSSHSPEFLDCFSNLEPSVTAVHWQEGETRLFPLPPERLRTWLERYRLGELFTSGDLDNLALPDVDSDSDSIADLEELPPASSYALLADPERSFRAYNGTTHCIVC